jgi:hypothetical protein
MRQVGIVAVVLALTAASARADDSSAALGAGGVTLTRSADIRMVDEVLSISPKAVKIRFVFLNETDRPIDVLVAFPMPDIDTEEYWFSPLGTTTDDPVNFMGFRVTADGAPASVSVEQRAMIKGRDVSSVVRAAGLPVNPISKVGFKMFEKLSPGQRKLLADAKVADTSDRTDAHPLWTVRTRFYWSQHFPAHTSVVLEQSYQPVTGQFLFGPTNHGDANYVRNFCLDSATRDRLSRMTKAALTADKQGGGYLAAYTTDYVLKTGANWKGPIGHFHMVLDKLSPNNVLSLCWKGALTKSGPTTFEFDAHDFTPDQDVRLLVVAPPTR